jgi:hypothetical protein
MTFYQQAFSNAAELVQFVNDTPVAQANIAAIVRRDTIYYLFYWA